MVKLPEGCTAPYSSVTLNAPLLGLTPDCVSVMTPETTTSTILWFGGHKEAGFAAAVMEGGVVSPEETSKVCTALLVTLGSVALVASRGMESSAPAAADDGTNRFTVTVPVPPLARAREAGETEFTKNWPSLAARLKLPAGPT